MKEQANKEKGAGNKLKKRHRKYLSAEEIEDIVDATLEPFGTHHVVAQKFRVTPSLVGRLVREPIKKPEVLQKLRERVGATKEKKEAVEMAVTKMLKSDKPIVRVQQVQKAVQEQFGHELPPDFVRQVMRKELRMGYRMAKTVTIQSNSERCLVLRQ